ncbi:MAG: NAD-dependent epimerase/dehydratase family protein [Candidatus Marinimicrobia bacterium]|nr:NAD-dependent epimerase/dehydratase family protein [Candidatus Neomarinimicrobiota bacterium]
MLVLVTGADGFLGSNLVRSLLDKGYSVRAMLQHGRNTGTLDKLDIDKIYADLLDLKSLSDAFIGVDVVIHTAAFVSIWPSRNVISRRVNIDGTRNVIDTVLKTGVKRMIHVGTANTFGFGSKNSPGNETLPYDGYKYGLDYMDTKYAAHSLVLEAVKNRGLPALIVNPTFMLGPYDSEPSSGAMIVAIYKGKISGFVPGGRNYIYVKDVADAIVNAVTLGEVSEAYILGHSNLTYKEIFNLIANTIGVKPPAIKFPKWLIIFIGALGSAWGRIKGQKPIISYPMSRISCDEHYYDASKAISKLKLLQTPIEVAVRESFSWMKEKGFFDKHE